MKSFLKWLAGVLAVFALLLLTFFIIISSLIDTTPKVVDNSFLHLSLSGSIPEYTAPDALEEALGKVTIDIKRLRDNLEKASVDQRINGVVLELSMLNIGYGKAQELHTLIQNYRKSGKKIYAYLGSDLAFTKDYYIASACDSIYMAPNANLFLTGISTEVTFYKDFFAKIGVEAEFAQIGKYKNAPDVYTRDSMSPHHRAVLENLLNYYYDHMVSTIAEKRGLSPAQLDKLINTQTGFNGKQALESGLIDGTLFRQAVEEKLKTTVRIPTRVTAADYSMIPASSLKIRNQSRIAVINCVGIIASGSDSDDPFLGTISGANSMVEHLRASARSSSIKAIILRIDSPGGSASASEVIWDAIREARRKKPVIASVADYGASGGYYVAMAADTMITTPGSLVGSIGIFAGKFNVQELYNKLDLHSETLKRGEHAALFSINQPWSRSERAVIERLIRAFYDEFVERVAEARDKDPQTIYDLAEGRVWTGQEAVHLGLFDQTGGFYDAVEIAKKMGGIDPDESVRLIYYPKRKSLFNQLFGMVSTRYQFWRDQKGMALTLLLNYLKDIQNRPLALMPFMLEIN